jgi:uncharacterized protein YacL
MAPRGCCAISTNNRVEALTAATIASLVFFVFSLVAAVAVEFLTDIAAKDGFSVWAFVTAPALLAMLFSLIIYQQAERKIRQIGQSVSRGILTMLMTWISLAALITWARYDPRSFFSEIGQILQVSGLVCGGEMLLCALAGGVVAALLILRMPKPRID